MHAITGQDLLRLLADFPADAYPAGITEQDGAMFLHGRPIEPTSQIVAWSCTCDQPLCRIDSDWSVDWASVFA